jgi:hypothetical protein
MIVICRQINWVTVNRFCDLSGYTIDAVHSKIKRGDWLEGVIWRKGPDGRRLISLENYDKWAEGRPLEFQSRRGRRAALKSTSTTEASAAESASG